MSRVLEPLPYAKVKKMIIKSIGTKRVGSERLPVDSALGRVSAEKVTTPSNVPAVPSSAMDGYAIRSSELAKADASHPVVFTVKRSGRPGGQKSIPVIRDRDTLYVVTGAPIPMGADAVIKVEETKLVGDKIVVTATIPKWKNVAPQGEEIKKGKTIVSPGDVVNAADIAVLVAAGRRDLLAVKRPLVGILSTGDELTTPEIARQGKIVNNYANLLAGYITQSGAIPVFLGVSRDDPAEILGIIKDRIGKLDLALTVGGSSVGRNDITPNALTSARDSMEVFHGIALIPIRPTGFYIVRGKPVVLVPSHSVAASLCFFLVVRPIINLLSGLEFDQGVPIIQASLTRPLANPRPVGAIHLAKLTTKEGRYEVTPLPWGSNLTLSLKSAQGFLQLGQQQSLAAGQEVAVSLLGAHEITRVSKRISR